MQLVLDLEELYLLCVQVLMGVLNSGQRVISLLLV